MERCFRKTKKEKRRRKKVEQNKILNSTEIQMHLEDIVAPKVGIEIEDLELIECQHTSTTKTQTLYNSAIKPLMSK